MRRNQPIRSDREESMYAFRCSSCMCGKKGQSERAKTPSKRCPSEAKRDKVSEREMVALIR